MAADDIQDAMETNAQGPRRVRGDEGEIEQHPLKDQIDAQRASAGATAVEKPHRGLWFSKFIPPRTES